MESTPDTVSFITRWSSSGAAERANYQLFLSELCDLIGVARPDPTKPDAAENAYVFERNVTFHHADGSTSTGRIDLYKRGCYVLEAKQGVEKREAAEALAEATKAKAKAAKKGTAQRGSAAWDEAMLKARGQAEQYARALPASEGRPPLLIVVDEAGGRLVEVVVETESGEDAANVTLTERTGLLHANLAIGANVSATVPLEANAGLSSRGMMLFGAGFILERDDAIKLGLESNPHVRKIIRPYRNGRDLTATPRNALVIDLFGLTPDEVRAQFPEVFQWVLNRVKPERDQNRDAQIRQNWWLHGRSRPELRAAMHGLTRYIATVETAKHRIFQFLDASILPDNKLIAFGLDDALFLGVLSSRIHGVYALAAGSWLGVGNDPVYVKTRCFETFPFPTASEAQQTRIREIAQALDAHRKRQQAQHPKLTLTDLYNVLEKLRAGTPLNAKEQLTHEHGLVSVLRQFHDDLDAAVAAAYALPPTASDEAILTHLCALNAQRAAEERTGTIRHLRPAFQNPAATATQTTLATDGTNANDATTSPAKATAKFAWPKTFAEQALAVRTALTAFAAPADAATLAKTFKSAKADRIEDILETLASLGQARALKDDRYVAA